MIEVGKTYKDWNGRTVRIIATDRLSPMGYSVVGLRRHAGPSNQEDTQVYTGTGKSASGGVYDLIVPERYVKLSDVLDAISPTHACAGAAARDRVLSLPTKEIEG
jgi:hypothetical protein